MVMVGGEGMKSKKKFLAVASAFETAVAYDDSSKYDLMIDAAAQLRTMLAGDDVDLTRADKVRVLKSLTKAKVRAFMKGTNESYRTFRTLDTISTDIVKLL